MFSGRGYHGQGYQSARFRLVEKVHQITSWHVIGFASFVVDIGQVIVDSVLFVPVLLGQDVFQKPAGMPSSNAAGHVGRTSGSRTEPFKGRCSQRFLR